MFKKISPGVLKKKAIDTILYKSMHDTIEKINKFVYGHITTLLIRGY